MKKRLSREDQAYIDELQFQFDELVALQSDPDTDEDEYEQISKTLKAIQDEMFKISGEYPS